MSLSAPCARFPLPRDVISSSHHFYESHIGASTSSTKGRHKAELLGDRYLSCQAAAGHGKPPIAGTPHQEFLLVKAKLLGPKQQNKHKYRAKRFIRHAQTDTYYHCCVEHPSELFLCMVRSTKLATRYFLHMLYLPIYSS